MATAPQPVSPATPNGWRFSACGIRIECGALRLAAIFIAATPRSKA